MDGKNEKSSITGWLIELGGGKDPSWVASFTRAGTPWFGYFAIEKGWVNYGNYEDLTKLALFSVAVLLTGSLAVKTGKWIIGFVNALMNENKADRIWKRLSESERKIIGEYARNRSDVVPVVESESLNSLVRLGVLIPLATGTITGNAPSGPYQLCVPMWSLVKARFGLKASSKNQQIREMQTRAAFAYKFASELVELHSSLSSTNVNNLPPEIKQNISTINSMAQEFSALPDDQNCSLYKILVEE